MLHYRLHKIIIAIIFLSFLNISYALLAPGLYTLEVNIADNKADTFDVALNQAWQQLLSKMLDPKSQEIISKKQLNLRQDFLLRHEYLKEHDVLKLRLEFKEDAIVNYFNNLQQAYLGKERPVTLLWLVLEDDSSSRVLNESMIENTALVVELQTAGNNVALPLIFPLLDLDDVITEVDIKTNDLAKMQANMERYNANSLLFGTLKQHNGNLSADLKLFFAGKKNLINFNHATAKDLAQAICKELMFNFVALRHNSVPEHISQDHNLVLEISGVKSFDDYDKAMNYLNKLSNIKSLEVVALYDNILKLHLILSHTKNNNFAKNNIIEFETNCLGDQNTCHGKLL